MIRRAIILNPVTVTIAMASVLLGTLTPRALQAMPVESQSVTSSESRIVLLDQAQEAIATPRIQSELTRNGIGQDMALSVLPLLSDEELTLLAEGAKSLQEGADPGDAAVIIAVLVLVVILGYAIWRYTKWVDWYQSDLRLRN